MKDKFYEILSDVLLKKSGGNMHEDASFRSSFSSFMLARYLSMREELLPYAQMINKYQMTLEPEQVYVWAYAAIPKQRNGYIKYFSKKKKDKRQTLEDESSEQPPGATVRHKRLAGSRDKRIRS